MNLCNEYVYLASTGVFGRGILTGSLMAVSKPPALPISLTPTGGIRALCCVGIVVAHCIYWASLPYENERQLYQGYAAQPWMDWVLHNAEPSMDAFLVLTGWVFLRSLQIGHTMSWLKTITCCCLSAFLGQIGLGHQRVYLQGLICINYIRMAVRKHSKRNHDY